MNRTADNRNFIAVLIKESSEKEKSLFYCLTTSIVYGENLGANSRTKGHI